MKQTIETLAVFANYMINKDLNNLEEVAGKIMCVIGVDEILKAYHVKTSYEASYSVRRQIAMVIIMDLLKSKLK